MADNNSPAEAQRTEPVAEHNLPEPLQQAQAAGEDKLLPEQEVEVAVGAGLGAPQEVPEACKALAVVEVAAE